MLGQAGMRGRDGGDRIQERRRGGEEGEGGEDHLSPVTPLALSCISCIISLYCFMQFSPKWTFISLKHLSCSEQQRSLSSSYIRAAYNDAPSRAQGGLLKAAVMR